MQTILKSESEFEQRIIVVGVGLIGGSVAAAVRKRFPDAEVIGVGRSEERLQAAHDAGLLTAWTTSPDRALLSTPCLVVICLPVHLISGEACRLAALASDGTLITDAGSVKGDIETAIRKDSTATRYFVGSHPIAGGEQGGFEFADADLYENRICVVVDGADETNNQRTKAFWKALGCQILTMSAEEHDQKLALTSHLPHVMAAITTSAVGTKNLSLTGSGFSDSTRIAAGDPALWTSILSGNRAQVVAALAAAETLLQQYRAVIESGDDTGLQSLLSDAAAVRNSLD